MEMEHAETSSGFTGRFLLNFTFNFTPHKKKNPTQMPNEPHKTKKYLPVSWNSHVANSAVAWLLVLRAGIHCQGCCLQKAHTQISWILQGFSPQPHELLMFKCIISRTWLERSTWVSACHSGLDTNREGANCLLHTEKQLNTSFSHLGRVSLVFVCFTPWNWSYFGSYHILLLIWFR